MNFFIRKGATQPVLVMRVNRDNDYSYEKFQSALENCAITFSMACVETNILKIAKKEGGLIQYEPEDTTLDEPEYYIYYKFTEKDTNRPGTYRAEFKIDFFDTEISDMTGTFIAPVSDDLFVIIRDSLFNETNSLNNETGQIFQNEFQNEFQ